MSDIINIKNYTDALRNTGYRNAESAIAEIVDNSLEAEANDILIICTQDSSSGKRRSINEIAILDNGIGMDIETLSSSLVIGESSRRARKGMGRFGVGLPQASLHVCPRVEVYSWQKDGEINMVYLDISEIKAGDQSSVILKKSVKVPTIYKRFFKKYVQNDIEMDFSKSGTLVVWKNCDRLKPKTVAPLFERFKRLLGRKFRYFVNNEKHNIGLTVANSNAYDEILKPNDPLCLMKDNLVLGDVKNPDKILSNGEPIFELWDNGDVCGVVEKDVPYYNSKDELKKSKIQIKFSIAKEEYQKAGGSSEIGKFLKDNVGVSIIRANREIDFGKFDFFSEVNKPTHRWWGCEVIFGPELDEVFGVANNKQQVELYELNKDEYSEEEVQPVWFMLNDLISKEINNMINFLAARAKGSRTKKKELVTEEQIVKQVEEGNTKESASQHYKNITEKEELLKLGKEKLIDGGIPDPSEDDIENALSVPVKLAYKDLGDNSTFIDIDGKMGNTWLTINTGSVFYRELYSKIEDEDHSVKKAFNLILMAFAKAEDESFNDKNLYESFKDVREQWGIKLRKYLRTDYKA
ncbi:ATP-binding protein [Halobacteriovorax sp. RT-2-6]|uniref:ATP-binding protein n=1 Tax=unclassified Halobacteriovorax TaxID=2639665 RepID=UPI003999A43A